MLSRKKRNMLKNIVGLVFAFLLTLCFTTIMLLIGCRLGIFNDAIIRKQLEKTDYYDSVHQAIYDNSAELLLPSGLPEDVLDGVISKEKVKKDSENTVTMGLKGEGYIPDTTELEERFTENINKYIEENNIKANSETEEGIKKVSEQINKEYKRCMKFPFIRYYAKYQTLFNKIFLPALLLFIVMSALICIILVRMQRWPHRGVRYISYATLASVLMMAVPVIVLIATNVHARINISPKYLYDLLVGVIETDMGVMLATSFVGIVFFGVELYLISRLKYNAEHARRD